MAPKHIQYGPSRAIGANVCGVCGSLVSIMRLAEHTRHHEAIWRLERAIFGGDDTGPEYG